MNITIDGVCDHTVMLADEELHDHYTKGLNEAGYLVYGRVTYQMMEGYWPTLVKKPTGDPSMDDFAVAIDNIQKVVFSHTLDQVSWKNSTLAKGDLKETILHLKAEPGRDILVGSPGMISALTRLNLIDEYQLCVHPVIAGKGLQLFKDINQKKVLKLVKSKPFRSGATVHYYVPVRE